MTAIDAHQHFWRYAPAGYPWIEPGGVLARDRLPGDVKPMLAKAGFDGCLAVQARQDEAETDWLLSLAAADSWILGVVGWTDVTAPDLDARLARWAGMPLVGIRHMVQGEADPRWLLRAGVVAGIRTVLARGLAYDILVQAPQRVHVPAFLDAIGADMAGGALVLDHAGKPDIAGGEWHVWADTIAAIAAHPDVVCKLSGLVTEADHRSWTADDIARYLDHLLACFGPRRLMFGSDWPVCLLAADYDGVVGLIKAFVARACPDHHAAIFGGTARAIYGIEERTR